MLQTVPFNTASALSFAFSLSAGLALLWTYGVCTGKITRQKFVELFATNPAKVVGLPNKGELRIGADADVVIFDPDWKGTITNKDSLHGIDYEPFEGFEIQGRDRAPLNTTERQSITKSPINPFTMGLYMYLRDGRCFLR